MTRSTWSFDDDARKLQRDLVSLDADGKDRTLRVPFYDRVYSVSRHGVFDRAGKPANPAVSVVVMSHVLASNHGEEGAESVWISYRECRGAGPLMGYFHENTGKTLERTFAGNMDALKTTGLRLGAEIVDDGGLFDLSLRFQALPELPVLLRFNDQDPPFPASCRILFPDFAQDRLDIRCLGVLGTYLAGSLIGWNKD